MNNPASRLLITAIAMATANLAQATTPSQEEMWQLIQQQQAQIAALQTQLQQTQQDTLAVDDKIEATAAMVEASAASSGVASQNEIGGYGELHYNNLRNGGSGEDKKELDFHRFVLFFGHRFNDSIKFFSELEIEHAFSGDGAPGEVELEQAYIDFSINPQLTARTGLFILPLGLINETHEPNTFYGVERNPVEKNIIPATWWEGGAALIGRPAAGFQYDLAVHSGLKTDSYNIRSGRQKVAAAKADSLAMTGRLKYTGIAGLELASSVNYQEDISQGQDSSKPSAMLWEAHAAWQYQGFGLRALYARWDIDGDGAKAAGKDEQVGWYIEPSYQISPQWGVFARYNVWDNSAGSRVDSEYSQVDVGVNYWPHPDVVLKLDYQSQTVPNGKDDYQGFNLGVGYQF